MNEVKQGPSRMRRTFSHESNRDSQLGDKIRNVLESASDAAGEHTGDGSPSDQGGFETPKAVGPCMVFLAAFSTAQLSSLCGGMRTN